MCNESNSVNSRSSTLVSVCGVGVVINPMMRSLKGRPRSTSLRDEMDAKEGRGTTRWNNVKRQVIIGVSAPEIKARVICADVKHVKVIL